MLLREDELLDAKFADDVVVVNLHGDKANPLLSSSCNGIVL